jgi:hypothetical protein
MERLPSKYQYYQELGLTGMLFLFIWFFTDQQWLIYVGLGFILLGVLVFVVRMINAKIWGILNDVTQRIGNSILLFLIYFLVVTPIGFFFRLVRKNKGVKDSNLVDCEDVFSAENLTKTW